MPTNTNILLVRHAEKPQSGVDLSVAGQARAQAYVIYFQNYSLDPGNSAPLTLSYLFAAADSDNSHRPRLTIEPLAQALNLKIDDKHKDKDYQQVADDVRINSKYDNTNVLICWHHEEILDLAVALGADAGSLPSQWPGEVFGWVLQLCYDAQGNVSASCLSEQLMYDDCGQNPPAEDTLPSAAQP